MEWKPVEGAEEMTPFELNGVALSSERHSALGGGADALPGTDVKTVQPLRRASLASLSSLK